MPHKRRAPWPVLALLVVVAAIGLGIGVLVSGHHDTSDDAANATTPALVPSSATVKRAKGYETAHRFARAFAAYLSSGDATRLKGASLSPELYRTIAEAPSRTGSPAGGPTYTPRGEKITAQGNGALLLTATLSSSEVSVPLTAQLEPTGGGWQVVAMTSSDGA